MSRPLIAIVGNQFSVYQKPVVELLNQRFTAAGYGTAYVCGGALETKPGWNSDSGPPRNRIYELARHYDVSGYVLLTATIGHFASEQKVVDLAKLFVHKPLVCFGPMPSDIASVTDDNYQGMRELMRHMTQQSKRKRFVFIRGFPENPDSLIREKAFRDVLSEQAIPIDEQLIVSGSFTASDAFYEMERLLKTTRNIDAVVAANDIMAQSAIHALRRHHISVPGDVIVSGFDDSHAASTCLPPLTTVHSSLKSKIDHTVDKLMDLITNGTDPVRAAESFVTPTRLIVRASTELELQPDNTSKQSTTTATFDAMEFKHILSRNLASLKAPIGLSQDDVVNDIVAMLVNGTEHRGSRLESALQQLHHRPEDIYWWRHLHHQISSMLPRYGSRGQAPNAIAVTTLVLSQIHETVWSVESTLQVAAVRHQENVYHDRAIMSQISDFDSLHAHLQVICDYYQSAHAFMCIYEQPGNQPDEQARLFFQYPANTLATDSKTYFASKDVLPGGFMSSNFKGPLIIEALCTGNTHLGYLVLDVSEDQYREQTNTGAIADLIASALWRCLTSI